MNYGLYYKEVEFNRQAKQVVNKAISTDLDWKRGELHSSQRSTRSSEVAWLRDRDLLVMLLRMVKSVNRSAHWNLNITGVESVQFGVYGEGDFYDWHVDQHLRPVNNTIRKMMITKGASLIWRYIDQMQTQGIRLLS